ncbi:protein of unknown function [Streptomyces murinus]
MVALSITDNGNTGTTPKAEHRHQDAEGGRGLDMVNAIAHRVLIHSGTQGCTVTAELYADPRLGTRSC